MPQHHLTPPSYFSFHQTLHFQRIARRQKIVDMYPKTPECTRDDLRAEEWWVLLAPHKADRTAIKPYFRVLPSRLKPSEFCTEYRSFNAFKFFCNSMNGIKIHSSSIMPQKPRGQSRLEKLPPEILGLIFQSSGPNDFIALSLCSQSLWALAIKWAQNGYRRWRNTYSLAGTPVIYASSDLKTLPQSPYDWYPESFPKEDRKGLGYHSFYCEGHDDVTEASVWFNDIVLQSHLAPFPYDDLYVQSFEHMITKADIPSHLHQSMRLAIPKMTIEKENKWLLRNLTKNEYIRMECVITTEGEATVSHVGNSWLTLDILLFWLICWRGDGSQTTWSWEQLEGYVGMTERGIKDALLDPTYGPLDDKFWPIWAGNWAGHSLEVIADQELDEVWIDRTKSIDTLAPKMLNTMYSHALAECFPERPRWERVFEQRGDVVDEEQECYTSDGVTVTVETETHKKIVIGSLRVHADCLCGCEL